MSGLWCRAAARQLQLLRPRAGVVCRDLSNAAAAPDSKYLSEMLQRAQRLARASPAAAHEAPATAPLEPAPTPAAAPSSRSLSRRAPMRASVRARMRDSAPVTQPAPPGAATASTSSTISTSAVALERELASVPLAAVRPAPFTATGGALRGMAPTAGGAGATLNLAALVNERTSLTRLVAFGVDLHRAARVPGAANLLAGCDWARDVEPILEWLAHRGFSAEGSARVLSIFPKIIAMKLDRMDQLLAYLEEKRFTAELVVRMIEGQPTILSLSAVEMDTRLGQVQQLFDFRAADVRDVVAYAPKCLTLPLKALRIVHASCTKSFCFGHEETRSLVKAAPKLLLTSPHVVAKNFELLHTELGLAHARIASTQGGCATALHCQHSRLRQRMAFLRHVGRLQLDPAQPLYTAPNVVASLDTERFVCQLAKRPVKDFARFLKTL